MVHIAHPTQLALGDEAVSVEALVGEDKVHGVLAGILVKPAVKATLAGIGARVRERGLSARLAGWTFTVVVHAAPGRRGEGGFGKAVRPGGVRFEMPLTLPSPGGRG